MTEAILQDWSLAFTDPGFLINHFDREPLAKPRAARSVVPFLTWETMARILTGETRPDVLVAREGSLISAERPSTIERARELFEDGCTIVVRQAEKYDPFMALIASTFKAAFNAPVNIHLFATPASARGFGWHYDCEDVFLAQTSGVKEYFLRENSVNPHPRIDAMPSDMQYESETTSIAACTMVPGDWLYIPHGWWHAAKSIEDSLTISVGVLSECGAAARIPGPGSGGRSRG